MTDPLSITASVIAVPGLAYSSAKTLNEVITSFSNAPKVLEDIGKDLQILQNLLRALQQPLNGVPNANLSEDEKACYESLRLALEACKGMCDEFSAKLSKMTSHSQGDKVNWWDNVASIMNEHGRVLRLCLQSCTGGLKETTAKAGTHVKYAKTFDEAKQVIGTMGNVTGGGGPTVVELAEAHDKSHQAIVEMSEEVAKKFWE